MLNCKQTTKLLSEKQDRPLSFRERVALRLHLIMCSGCTNYDRQMGFIRKACRRIGGDDAK
ncbi:zf-HC2 domain-containing protein [Sedimenticola hydrogenitrophicus]|uniref:zf-HC2 domain-containing protein n=1 Tax=Sedimenticola hydrogenitrophicus TaxID=2967975 RepID=UPI0023B1263E|nr:zf-HC2 domain-containing protein [Sedimenticola hydrogenitrophicus]